MTNEKSTQELKAKLGAAGQLTPSNFDALCRQFFAENSKRLAGLAGSESEAKTIFLAALNSVSRSPQLLEAAQDDFQGFARCLATSCELRLFPGPLGECAYVPIRNNKLGKTEVHFWPQYQGLVKLAFQSGLVRAISADVVYAADEFDFCRGTAEFLRHKPFLGAREQRGPRICAYAVIQTAHGWQIEVMSMAQIEVIKNKSRGGKSEFSPWNADAETFDAMARKTVLKRALKLVPKSIHLAEAIEIDDKTDAKTVLFDAKKLIESDVPEPEQVEIKSSETLSEQVKRAIGKSPASPPAKSD